MALVHSNVSTIFVRNKLADLVVDLFDVGTTNANAYLIFQTAASGEVATILLDDPSFGPASGGIATLLGSTDDTNAAGGTVTKFIIQDQDANLILTGTVTATGGGGDIEMTSTVIVPTTTVALGSLTYTASA